MNEQADEVRWFVEELTWFRGILWVRGWAFHPHDPIVRIACAVPGRPPVEVGEPGLPSSDVEADHGPAARSCRFAASLTAPDRPEGPDVELVFTLAGGRRVAVSRLLQPLRKGDACQRVVSRFFEALAAKPAGTVLELGSRDRTGIPRGHLVPAGWRHVGLDIVAAENVDVVGDVHALSAFLGEASVDAVFAMAVFEHLIMPWKAALEINHVLRPGGLFMALTHQTFPLHEQPWDYFRFSERAWRGLFNRPTGFEIVDSACSVAASVVCHELAPRTAELPEAPAFVHSAVLARKVTGTGLRWDVSLDEIEQTSYPC